VQTANIFDFSCSLKNLSSKVGTVVDPDPYPDRIRIQ
jgi:hypothetical protein